jgi:hypothetical protein
MSHKRKGQLTPAGEWWKRLKLTQMNMRLGALIDHLWWIAALLYLAVVFTYLDSGYNQYETPQTEQEYSDNQELERPTNSSPL